MEKCEKRVSEALRAVLRLPSIPYMDTIQEEDETVEESGQKQEERTCSLEENVDKLDEGKVNEETDNEMILKNHEVSGEEYKPNEIGRKDNIKDMYVDGKQGIEKRILEDIEKKRRIRESLLKFDVKILDKKQVKHLNECLNSDVPQKERLYELNERRRKLNIKEMYADGSPKIERRTMDTIEKKRRDRESLSIIDENTLNDMQASYLNELNECEEMITGDDDVFTEPEDIAEQPIQSQREKRKEKGHIVTSTLEKYSPSPRSDDEGWEDEEDEGWENLALEICQREMGTDRYRKRMAKQDKKHTSGFGSKTRLSYLMSRIKKITTSPEGVQHYNAIGAVGYAVVRPDPRVPEDRFFVDGKRFRVRLRHCAIRCEDDAASCIRQAALKFADQNEDGPLDVILCTGRAAPARNCKTFREVLLARSPEQVKALCNKDPKYFYALVDALRRAPSSYSNLRYHSQLAYLFTPKDEKLRMARFRLVPADNSSDRETGLLEAEDQHTPWASSRDRRNKRPMDYLRRQFYKQLEDSPVRYRLQIQVRSVKGSENEMDELWNPQTVWDEADYPWLNLMELIFTTPLPQTATNRTAFNVVNRPKCLNFLPPSSIWDYKSYHTSCSTMYTTMELKNLNQINNEQCQVDRDGRAKVTYMVTLCTGNSGSKGMPKVDVFITLTGVSGRTAAARLDKRMDGSEEDDLERHFRIRVDDVGDVLAVTMGVRHRQLTADWMLRYVSLTNVVSGDVRLFPCHRVVLSRVTLRPGNVCLPNHEIHEVVRQERALEIRDRQQDHLWRKLEKLPSMIRAQVPKDLPAEQRLLADKYAGLPWDLEATMEEMTRHPTNVGQPGGGHHSASRMSQCSAPFYGRQSSVTEDAMGRRRSTSAFQTMPPRKASMVLRRTSTSNTARLKWSKIKLALNFISRAAAKIPDGVKGDMCRACLEDADVGRLFTQGPNPVVLRRVIRVPDKMAVTDAMMEPLMERELSFTQEMQAGRVFLADYALLDDIPLCNKNGSSRHCAAPVALLYVSTSGNLIPLAIQLHQQAAENNPVWVASDPADGWLLAKLWLRFADSINQFATHVFYCHLVVEPFVVATLRQLSASHPIYKLLKPHFRYLLAGNTLIRMHVLGRGGALDRWTSVGSEGNRAMMERLYADFHLDQLDFMEDLRRRGVDNNRKLTNYYYRDDGIRLWNAVSQYCTNLVEHFYRGEDDVINDGEIQAWLSDVRENGFPGRADDIGLPAQFTDVTQLSALVCKVLFTVTCRHAATHSEAMDMYGHDAAVPATMRQPPPTDKVKVNKELTIETLPDQKPELYNTAMAYIMSLKKADQSALGKSTETYFVESEAKDVHDSFRKQLAFVSRVIVKRNKDIENPYDKLLPDNIPNSVEPLPFLPDATPEVEGVFIREGYERRSSSAAPSVPLLAMPICMTFARSIGGKSTLGRRLSVNMFSKAMSGIDMERVNVPMNAIERTRFGLERMHYQDTGYQAH